MKKLTAIILATLTLHSCQRITNGLEVKFSVPQTRQVSAPGLPGNPPIPPQGLTTSLLPVGVETKSEQYIREYNTSSDLVTDARLGQIKLDLQEPAGQTFDMVDSLWLFVAATGMPEVLAAHAYGIPKGLRTLDMNTADQNLKGYFLQDSMFFRLQGHFYTAPDSATTFTITTRFDVVANPLKK